MGAGPTLPAVGRGRTGGASLNERASARNRPLGRCGRVGSPVVSGLEPDRRRRRIASLLARVLWGIAIGFALAMAVALVLR